MSHAVLAGLLLAATALNAIPARAEVVQVKAQGVRFIPNTLRANVGDVIAFRNMAAQAVESAPGMWPEGAPEARSDLNADYDYPVEREGLYVFRSRTHWRARMGVVMVVGDPAAFAGKVAEYEALSASDKEAKPASGLLKVFRERMGLK